jgi:hypothetical protein
MARYARNWLGPIRSKEEAEAYRTIAEGLFDPTLREERLKAEYNHAMEANKRFMEQVWDSLLPHRHIVEALAIQQRLAEIEQEKRKRQREMEEYRQELERRRQQQ